MNPIGCLDFTGKPPGALGKRFKRSLGDLARSLGCSRRSLQWGRRLLDSPNPKLYFFRKNDDNVQNFELSLPQIAFLRVLRLAPDRISTSPACWYTV